MAALLPRSLPASFLSVRARRSHKCKMSKRSHESAKSESREERWLRKLKWYEDKLEQKRKRVEPEIPRVESETPRDETDMRHEEYLDSNEGIPELFNLGDSEGNLDDQGIDDISQMTETTTCLSPKSNPGEDKDDVTNIEDFDPELLRELGDTESDPIEFGDDLQTDVAARFQKILLEGLKKEIKEELLKKYPFPKNVPLAKGPTLNPEIGAMLAEPCKQRDKRLLTKQDQLGKALSSLGKALTGLLKKKPDIPDVIRTLNDAGRLLADSHYAETDTRRSVIIPLIDKSLTDPFKDRKRDTFLFGEKLGELVKDSRGIKKTGQMIQPSSTNSNLNGKGPSARAARHQYQRGGQAYQHRTGGPRAANAAPAYPYPNRRRAPQPPARRHQTMPPPPAPAPPPSTRRPPAPAQPSSSTSR